MYLYTSESEERWRLDPLSFSALNCWHTWGRALSQVCSYTFIYVFVYSYIRIDDADADTHDSDADAAAYGGDEL